MKNLDTFSKRLFVVSISISLVLLSISVFIITIQKATARPNDGIQAVMPTFVGIGVVGDRGYYLQWSGKIYNFEVKSVDLKKDKEVPH